MISELASKQRTYSIEKTKQWPILLLLISLLFEILLNFWVAGDARLSMSYVSPSLIVLISFIFWYKATAVLGMFGSALLGAFLLNSVVDGAFAWTLFAEGTYKSSLFSVLVPSFHFVFAVALLLRGRNFNLHARWVFAGCLAFFILRALLLIPVYARWSGEIAGMTQNLSQWTGVKILPKATFSAPDQLSLEALVGGAEEFEPGCGRPNGELYRLSKAETLKTSELVWGECGFDKLQRLIEFGTELKLKNDTEIAVQLRFSIFDIKSMDFEKTWNLVLFPNSLQVVSQFELEPTEIALIYSPDSSERGVLALFPSGMRASIWIEHSPLVVRLINSSD